MLGPHTGDNGVFPTNGDKMMRVHLGQGHVDVVYYIIYTVRLLFLDT